MVPSINDGTAAVSWHYSYILFSNLQIAKCPALLRFLRWAVAKGHLKCDRRSFKLACSSLLLSSTAVEQQLPESFYKVTEQEGGELNEQPRRKVLSLAWAHCSGQMNTELEAAAEAAGVQAKAAAEAATEAAGVQAKATAEVAKALAKLESLVASTSAAVRPTLNTELAPLYAIREVVRLDEKPMEADRAAVWEEFQWVRELYAALQGGTSAYKQWFQRMTDVDSGSTGGPEQHVAVRARTRRAATAAAAAAAAAAVPVESTHRADLWDRLDNEYHSIMRAQQRPGVFFGGRLQCMSNGKWEDMAGGAFSAGPHRVVVSYKHAGAGAGQGGTLDDFAGLLVKLPAVVTGMLSSGSGKDALESWPLELAGEDGQQRSVVLHGKQVHFVRVVLTAPRLHFLERIADVYRLEGQGVLLQGLHGAGKSSMLKAFVSILSTGADSHVLYSPRCQDLASLQVESLLGKAMHGSGSLAQQLLSGRYSPDMSNELWQTGLDAVFSAMWRTMAAQKEADEKDKTRRHPEDVAKSLMKQMEQTTAGIRVVVFDEVNELLKAIDYHTDTNPIVKEGISCTSREFWKEWLGWKGYGGTNCFRVLASSPHGERERSDSVTMAVEFELRPAPADHLAAVLQCAPEYLGAKSTLADGGAGCAFSADESLHVCEALGSNARFIAQFLQKSASRQALGGGTGFEVALASALEACVRKLSMRFTKRMAQFQGRRRVQLPAAISAGASPKLHSKADITMFELARQDASLVVRSEATSELEPTVLAGSPALLAITGTIGSKSPLGVWLLSEMIAADFKTAMTVAMGLGIAARRMWPLAMMLDSAAAVVQRTKHKASSHGTVHGSFEWSSISSASSGSSGAALCGVMGSFDAESSSAGSPVASGSDAPVSVLCGAIVPPVKVLFGTGSLLRQKRIVFQTVPNFPGIDAVCIDLVGNAVHVTFWEITISTLVDHAKNRKPVPSILRCAGKQDRRGAVQVGTALRDVLATMGVKSRQCTMQPGGHVVLADAGDNTLACSEDSQEDMDDDLTGGTSTVNCLLATLGVPLVVKSRLVMQPKKKTPAGCVNCELKLSVVNSTSLCDQLHGKDGWQPAPGMSWSFQMVYASRTSLERNVSKQYSTLDADFVCGVFQDDLWC